MLKYKNIKVKFNLEERKEAIDQIIPLLRCKEKFAQYGITISEFNYDILISHHAYYSNFFHINLISFFLIHQLGYLDKVKAYKFFLFNFKKLLTANSTSTQ